MNYTVTIVADPIGLSVDGAPITLTVGSGAGETGTEVIISDTPPLLPRNGQPWYDPEDSVMSFWTGTEWITWNVAITSGESSAFAHALIFG